MPWRSPFHHESMAKSHAEALPPIIQGTVSEPHHIPTSFTTRSSVQGALLELPRESLEEELSDPELQRLASGGSMKKSSSWGSFSNLATTIFKHPTKAAGAVADVLPPLGPRPSPGLPIPSPPPGQELKRGSVSRLSMQPHVGWNPQLKAMTQTDIPAVREEDVHCLIGGFIKEGGCAVVHKAECPVIGRQTFAYKRLKTGASAQEQEALASELGLLCAAGRHRHLLQIRSGVIDSQGTVVGILTDLKAGNLHDLINQWRRQTGHLKQLQLADIGAQMADALAHLHMLGIIHADVKPDNFLFQARAIGARPHLALCDLGMGCQLHEDEVAYQYKDCRGSWHFAAREMLLHSWVCRESDVYSLGNMLACLARLRCFPYPREYQWKDIAALAMQPDGGLPELPAHSAHQLQQLCSRCWARDPADRPSAAAAHRSLRGWQLQLLLHLEGDASQHALPGLWRSKKHTWSVLGRAPPHQQGFMPDEMEDLWGHGALTESSLVCRLEKGQHGEMWIAPLNPSASRSTRFNGHEVEVLPGQAPPPYFHAVGEYLDAFCASAWTTL
ncbi:hypothetical protein WJX84_006085 [Apatococcus fuscideae]|uniref:Protein kinase domain-containing protein n=1 Tax=Apatococcus fuscideae TaxID=2026836 RepID=A0AAW1T8U4_9CHLO